MSQPRMIAVLSAVMLASAGAARGDVEVVVRIGDEAPGTGGARYTGFDSPEMNAAGELAFTGLLDAAPEIGVFLASKGALQAIALPGDPTPIGGAFGAIARDVISPSGAVGYFGAVSNSPVSSGGSFIASEGAHSVVAYTGQPAPGTPGQLIEAPVRAKMDASGDIAFSALLLGPGGGPSGLFRNSGGVLSPIALHGDPAPGTGGGTFRFTTVHYEVDSNAAGEMVFVAEVIGGLVTKGIFRASGGTSAPVVLLGGAAPIHPSPFRC